MQKLLALPLFAFLSVGAVKTAHADSVQPAFWTEPGRHAFQGTRDDCVRLLAEHVPDHVRDELFRAFLSLPAQRRTILPGEVYDMTFTRDNGQHAVALVKVVDGVPLPIRKDGTNADVWEVAGYMLVVPDVCNNCSVLRPGNRMPRLPAAALTPGPGWGSWGVPLPYYLDPSFRTPSAGGLLPAAPVTAVPIPSGIWVLVAGMALLCLFRARE
jgi:hypothetical protein